MRWRQAYILRRMQGRLSEPPEGVARRIPKAMADSIAKPIVVDVEAAPGAEARVP